jgi:hypothetical protein
VDSSAHAGWGHGSLIRIEFAVELLPGRDVGAIGEARIELREHSACGTRRAHWTVGTSILGQLWPW